MGGRNGRGVKQGEKRGMSWSCASGASWMAGSLSLLLLLPDEGWRCVADEHPLHLHIITYTRVSSFLIGVGSSDSRTESGERGAGPELEAERGGC